MKVCYNLQSENPYKHELMPGGYPWTEYIVEDDFVCPEGFIELPLDQYEILKASFDLSAFIAATTPVQIPTLEDRILILEQKIASIEAKLPA